MKRSERGITLIALVITIIVLLILAGVSIAMLTGDNGILTQANKAKTETENAKKDEKNKLSQNEDYITESLISWNTVPNEVYSITSDGILTVADKTLINNYSNIKIPSEVNGIKITTIDERAFQENSIKNIIIPEGITELKKISFNSCSNLEYIRLPQSLISIGSDAFENCTKLKKIIIPNNVINIDSFAFNLCTNLATVKLGNGLKNIGTQAFGRCSIEEITIPSNVESLGWGVFYNCTNLKNVYIESTKLTSTSNFGGDVFKYMTSGSTIYVRNADVAAALEGQYNPENTTVSTNYNW